MLYLLENLGPQPELDCADLFKARQDMSAAVVLYLKKWIYSTVYNASDQASLDSGLEAVFKRAEPIGLWPFRCSTWVKEMQDLELPHGGAGGRDTPAPVSAAPEVTTPGAALWSATSQDAVESPARAQEPQVAGPLPLEQCQTAALTPPVTAALPFGQPCVTAGAAVARDVNPTPMEIDLPGPVIFDNEMALDYCINHKPTIESDIPNRNAFSEKLPSAGEVWTTDILTKASGARAHLVAFDVWDRALRAAVPLEPGTSTGKHTRLQIMDAGWAHGVVGAMDALARGEKTAAGRHGCYTAALLRFDANVQESKGVAIPGTRSEMLTWFRYLDQLHLLPAFMQFGPARKKGNELNIFCPFVQCIASKGNLRWWDTFWEHIHRHHLGVSPVQCSYCLRCFPDSRFGEAVYHTHLCLDHPSKPNDPKIIHEEWNYEFRSAGRVSVPGQADLWIRTMVFHWTVREVARTRDERLRRMLDVALHYLRGRVNLGPDGEVLKGVHAAVRKAKGITGLSPNKGRSNRPTTSVKGDPTWTPRGLSQDSEDWEEDDSFAHSHIRDQSRGRCRDRSASFRHEAGSPSYEDRGSFDRNRSAGRKRRSKSRGRHQSPSMLKPSYLYPQLKKSGNAMKPGGLSPASTISSAGGAYVSPLTHTHPLARRDLSTYSKSDWRLLSPVVALTRLAKGPDVASIESDVQDDTLVASPP